MFECKLASNEELIKKWDYEIGVHPNDNRWVIWKDVAVSNAINNNRIVFIGCLDGEIIAECTAIISKQDTGLENKEFVSDDTAYLEAFRVVKQFQNKGYFSKLYRFMEEWLRTHGYSRLILGVEPNEIRNMKIYFHYGFDKLVATKTETYPPIKEGDEPEKYLVNYYMKEL